MFSVSFHQSTKFVCTIITSIIRLDGHYYRTEVNKYVRAIPPQTRIGYNILTSFIYIILYYIKTVSLYQNKTILLIRAKILFRLVDMYFNLYFHKNRGKIYFNHFLFKTLMGIQTHFVIKQKN